VIRNTQRDGEGAGCGEELFLEKKQFETIRLVAVGEKEELSTNFRE
jgi:hypothetical protein